MSALNSKPATHTDPFLYFRTIKIILGPSDSWLIRQPSILYWRLLDSKWHQNFYARVYGLLLKYLLEVYYFASAISSLKMCGCLGHFPSLLDTIQVLTTQFVLYAVAIVCKKNETLLCLTFWFHRFAKFWSFSVGANFQLLLKIISVLTTQFVLCLQ